MEWVRCVLDLQAVQGDQRDRETGCYSREIAHALLAQLGQQELWLVLNGFLSDSVESVRADFDGSVPQARITTFDFAGPVSFNDKANEWRLRAAEKLRSYFIAELKPDLIFIPSLFEGYHDNIVTTIDAPATSVPTVATLHDLAPLSEPEVSLPDPRQKEWYYRKAMALKAADLLLAVSNYARARAIDCLNISEDKIIVVGRGVEPQFKPADPSGPDTTGVIRRHNISQHFVLCSREVNSRNDIEALVNGFALVPLEVRKNVQLVIENDHWPNRRDEIGQVLRKAGLDDKCVVFAQCQSTEERVALYNLCTVFVIPSAGDGFPTSALEALACGTPSIGADSGIVREILECKDALFESGKPAAIAKKLQQALTSDDFRRSLREQGLRRARLFTWEACARRVLDAFDEALLRRRVAERSPVPAWQKSPTLAYVWAGDSQADGLGDSGAALLPELAKSYNIEVIALEGIRDPWITSNFPIRDLRYFGQQSAKYDRVLYQLGSSHCYWPVLGMLKHKSGVVVLHDFYIGELLDFIEARGLNPDGFESELYASHGYDALLFEKREGRSAAIAKYPSNRRVLDRAAGIVVLSEQFKALADEWYGRDASKDWRAIPKPKAMHHQHGAGYPARDTSREFFVCCFGPLRPTKLNHRIITAWIASGLARDPACRLVFVGEVADGTYDKQLRDLITGSECGEQILVTGRVSRGDYCSYLEKANVAVDLRSESKDESFETLLDCLAHGVPTIVSGHRFVAGVPDGTVARIPQAFDDAELICELERLFGDSDYRQALSASAVRYVKDVHYPSNVARMYRDAIEDFARNHPRSVEERLICNVASTEATVQCEDRDLRGTASAIAIHRKQFGPGQLLMDVSGTARYPGNTGVQRVARHLAREIISTPPAGFRPEPIHDLNGSYTYGRRFSMAMFDQACAIPDDPIEVRDGDVLLGLDICTEAIRLEQRFLEGLRARNISMQFVVFDLLPILQPEMFPKEEPARFRVWLETLSEVADGLICISRSVADELLNWLEAEQISRLRPLNVGYFHLGANIWKPSATSGVPHEANAVLAATRLRPSVLMVGTVEPRKGHAQALAAIEQLWADGVDANLVIIGVEGWNVKHLTGRLNHHPEAGKRLFWLSRASDELLSQIYSASTVLLSASLGEGFGLPLIEGAMNGLPIIARDLPIFREVAGEHAFYFEGRSAESLASALHTWLDLNSRGLAPPSKGIIRLTWQQSASQLLEVVTGSRKYQEWSPRQGARPRKNSTPASF